MSANEYRNETRLEHMLRFIDRIVSLTEGMTRASIETDGDKHDALLHNFIMLGEAANRITRDFAEAHSDIDWRRIAGTRHRLVHDYDEVDYDVLWDAMTNDIPHLRPLIKALVDALPPVSSPDNIEEFR